MSALSPIASALLARLTAEPRTEVAIEAPVLVEFAQALSAAGARPVWQVTYEAFNELEAAGLAVPEEPLPGVHTWRLAGAT